ncbi:hypothetical protein ACD631_16200 [Alteromonas macleodii]|uniref:hypothetical protein n=1 Tax=Alteromonas macleodii TaxID=28108 RepID=UPI0036F49626
MASFDNLEEKFSYLAELIYQSSLVFDYDKAFTSRSKKYYSNYFEKAEVHSFSERMLKIAESVRLKELHLVNKIQESELEGLRDQHSKVLQATLNIEQGISDAKWERLPNDILLLTDSFARTNFNDPASVLKLSQTINQVEQTNTRELQSGPSSLETLTLTEPMHLEIAELGTVSASSIFEFRQKVKKLLSNVH